MVFSIIPVSPIGLLPPNSQSPPPRGITGTFFSLAILRISEISSVVLGRITILAADPEALSASITGASSKTVSEWQNNAKALINS